MKLPIEGGCACKKIRYSCNSEPFIMLNCHCRDCQYRSGNSHSSIFGVPISSVKIKGEIKYYQSTSDQGNVVRRGFCPDCGCPVCSRNDSAKELIAIIAGTLDDSSWFKPSMDVWVASAQAWDVFSTETTQFDYDPQF